ncbi:MAG: NAD(+) diphosphatase [Syntrophobacteraceae bacterium]|nr:NAD(+) diphosphatase [Syntrophobacteraceae bacterium]
MTSVHEPLDPDFVSLSLSEVSLLGFNRSSSKRGEAFLEESRGEKEPLYLPVWDSLNLFSPGTEPKAVVLGSSGIGRKFLCEFEPPIYLGETTEHSFFALCLPSGNGPCLDRISRHGRFLDLRKFLSVLDPDEISLLAYAKALDHWQRRSRFCGACGARTQVRQGGHMRVCSNGACARQYFPRTDPAVIVLVLWREQCLLGRQPSWLKGRYSVLAGFVEPGETLEEAVLREVEEETGVRVDRIRYHSSQPWPFPSSLMVGFTAWARDERIRMLPGELEDARWFSRMDISRSLENDSLVLPPPVSIAYRLVREWFDAGSPRTLDDLVKSLPHRISFR